MSEMSCSKELPGLHDVVGLFDLASHGTQGFESLLRNSLALQKKLGKIYMRMGQAQVVTGVFQAAAILFQRDYAAIKNDILETIFVESNSGMRAMAKFISMRIN